MTKQIKFVFVIAALLALAFVLNPSADRHRDVIQKTISERSQVEKLFGMGHLAAFASRYHTFFIGSYTTVDDKVQSVGMFGLVYVTE